ncbi:MAG: hypothetical protein Q8O46_00445, partial [bacterium]|nr:hypothetical protein [bacterium]
MRGRRHTTDRREYELIDIDDYLDVKMTETKSIHEMHVSHRTLIARHVVEIENRLAIISNETLHLANKRPKREVANCYNNAYYSEMRDLLEQHNKNNSTPYEIKFGYFPYNSLYSYYWPGWCRLHEAVKHLKIGQELIEIINKMDLDIQKYEEDTKVVTEKINYFVHNYSTEIKQKSPINLSGSLDFYKNMVNKQINSRRKRNIHKPPIIFLNSTIYKIIMAQNTLIYGAPTLNRMAKEIHTLSLEQLRPRRDTSELSTWNLDNFNKIFYHTDDDRYSSLGKDSLRDDKITFILQLILRTFHKMDQRTTAIFLLNSEQQKFQAMVDSGEIKQFKTLDQIHREHGTRTFRHKRAAPLLVFGVISGILGTFLGMYNSVEIEQLKSRLNAMG